jgi:hypothetical protein
LAASFVLTRPADTKLAEVSHSGRRRKAARLPACHPSHASLWLKMSRFILPMKYFCGYHLRGLNEEETTNAQIDIRSCRNGGAIFGWISDHGC